MTEPTIILSRDEIEAVLASLKARVENSSAISTPIEVQWTDEVAAAGDVLPLHTKLSMPPLRPHLVRRARLLHALDEGLERGHGFTLVSAPPGFGKNHARYRLAGVG